MPSKTMVTVRDTFLLAGETYVFMLYPEDGAYMRGSMFLMGSHPSEPSTWVRPRSSRLVEKHGEVNEPVVFQFTAPRSDRYGLVIFNLGSPGSFALQRIQIP